MRLVVTAVGSGGDVLPFIGLSRALASAHQVVLLTTPRFAAIARHLGVAAAAPPVAEDSSFGREPGVKPTADEAIARFYEPLHVPLRDHLVRLVDRLRPDLVIAHGAAGHAVQVGIERRVPITVCHLWPELLDRLPPGMAYPSTLLGAGEELVSEVALTDAVLLGRRRWTDVVEAGAVKRIDYPYFDETDLSAAKHPTLESWLAGSDRPVVACTFGSFLGPGSPDFWKSCAALGAGGVRTILLNVPADDPAARDIVPDCFPIAYYYPLSRVAANVAALVHHGGLGTAHATLRFGLPSITVPHAFDQPLVAAALESIEGNISVSNPDEIAAAVADSAHSWPLPRGRQSHTATLTASAHALLTTFPERFEGNHDSD